MWEERQMTLNEQLSTHEALVLSVLNSRSIELQSLIDELQNILHWNGPTLTIHARGYLRGAKRQVETLSALLDKILKADEKSRA